jgi:LPXTG-motif cell wall-anchored protein
MADGDGVVSTRDPDALVKEIERTRENLARTIDALTERISPANAARRVAARAREQAARPEVQRAAGAAGAAVLAGLAGYLFRRRRRKAA